MGKKISLRSGNDFADKFDRPGFWANTMLLHPWTGVNLSGMRKV
jgi:hypothetical protein